MFWRKELQTEIKNQKYDIEVLKVEKLKWHKVIEKNQQLRKRDADLVDEINKLKPQVREQTEADLFFASAKICFELLNAKSKNEVKTLIEHQQAMRNRLAAMQQQSSMPFYGGFQQSVLGGLLGRYL